MKKPIPWLPILAGLWAATLFLLGGWWLYLIWEFGKKLEELGEPGINLVRLATWEGATFIVMLSLLSATLLILYYKNQKRTRELQNFFAGLTHEIRTPIASMRLQSEVMIEALSEEELNIEKFRQLLTKSIEDGKKLEDQVDRLLHLSRLESDQELTLVEISLDSFLEKKVVPLNPNFQLKFKNSGDDLSVKADPIILELIFKNLIQNTTRHASKNSAELKVVEETEESMIFQYSDEGLFKGDPHKLGQLFYKYDSEKGSGIGLYLIRRALNKMAGSFTIRPNQQGGLNFFLGFKKAGLK